MGPSQITTVDVPALIFPVKYLIFDKYADVKVPIFSITSVSPNSFAEKYE
jgi:hypothetical protein